MGGSAWKDVVMVLLITTIIVAGIILYAVFRGGSEPTTLLGVPVCVTPSGTQTTEGCE